MPALASLSLPGSPGGDITSQILKLGLEDANHLRLELDRLLLGLTVLKEQLVVLLVRGNGRALDLDGDEHHRHQSDGHQRDKACQLHVDDDVLVVHDGLLPLWCHALPW